MHYARSRTYAKKLELDLEGKVFFEDGLYLETVLKLKNLGAARHTLAHRGTSCSVWAVLEDLSEVPIVSEPVFGRDNSIEPGESVDESMVFRIDFPPEAIVWFKVALRVVSREGEWNLTRHIRVEIVKPAMR
jgi:hypothetical protein